MLQPILIPWYSTCLHLFFTSTFNRSVYRSTLIPRQIKTDTLSPPNPRPPEPDPSLHQLRVFRNGQAPSTFSGESARTAHMEIPTEPGVEVFKCQLAGQSRTHIPELFIFIVFLTILTTFSSFHRLLSRSGEPQHGAQRGEVLRRHRILPVGVGQVMEDLLQVLVYSSGQDDYFVLHAGFSAVVMGQGASERISSL